MLCRSSQSLFSRQVRLMTRRTGHSTLGGGQSNQLSPGREAAALEAFNSPLPVNTLNIKAKSRSNLFPWRGQFSAQLVEALLRAYAVPGSVLLDPFMGSGTVLVEAARLGLPAYGCEVNPAAFLLGRVYELCNRSADERRYLLDQAEAILSRARPTAFEPQLFRPGADPVYLPDNGSDWVTASSDPQVRILLQALVVLLDADGASDCKLANTWSTICEIVVSLPFTDMPLRASLGDARSLHLPDGAIDFVLSSPPYINVFNYHHNLRAGVESLGWRPLVVARSEIGSNRKFRQNRFLTVVQYCIDMALALAEIRRVCSESARIILILGRESNVHKTAFYNGQILETLATEVVGLRIHLKQDRVFVNRFGQDIYEDILHLSSPPDDYRPTGDIVRCARSVGRDVLAEAIERTPSDRKRYLHDAISGAARVEASPILEPDAANGGVL